MLLADRETVSSDGAVSEPAGENRDWNWHPELPVVISPLFDWPPRPLDTVRWFARNWLPVTEYMIYLIIALAVWTFLQPGLEETRELGAGWIAAIWLRNIVMMTAFTAGLHLWLYGWKRQGLSFKYDRRGLAESNRTFAFNSQLWDNVLWSLASGVTIWTIYEVVLWWAYANGVVPMIGFEDSPVWFVLLFLLLPVWQSFHFYWVHRFLHWPPLYRLAHAVHHRNVSVGPWSGFSMHPIEHVIYLSAPLVFLVVPSHPLHMLFLWYWLTLATATSHSGYENVILGDRAHLKIGSFFHQLHHRYFECNYGNVEMPWDRWFGSHHDGTPEATRRTRERKRRMHGA